MPNIKPEVGQIIEYRPEFSTETVTYTVTKIAEDGRVFTLKVLDNVQVGVVWFDTIGQDGLMYLSERFLEVKKETNQSPELKPGDWFTIYNDGIPRQVKEIKEGIEGYSRADDDLPTIWWNENTSKQEGFRFLSGSNPQEGYKILKKTGFKLGDWFYHKDRPNRKYQIVGASSKWMFFADPKATLDLDYFTCDNNSIYYADLDKSAKYNGYLSTDMLVKTDPPKSESIKSEIKSDEMETKVEPLDVFNQDSELGQKYLDEAGLKLGDEIHFDDEPDVYKRIIIGIDNQKRVYYSCDYSSNILTKERAQHLPNNATLLSSKDAENQNYYSSPINTVKKVTSVIQSEGSLFNDKFKLGEYFHWSSRICGKICAISYNKLAWIECQNKTSTSILGKDLKKLNLKTYLSSLDDDKMYMPVHFNNLSNNVVFSSREVFDNQIIEIFNKKSKNKKVGDFIMIDNQVHEIIPVYSPLDQKVLLRCTGEPVHNYDDLLATVPSAYHNRIDKTSNYRYAYLSEIENAPLVTEQDRIEDSVVQILCDTYKKSKDITLYQFVLYLNNMFSKSIFDKFLARQNSSLKDLENTFASFDAFYSSIDAFHPSIKETEKFTVEFIKSRDKLKSKIKFENEVQTAAHRIAARKINKTAQQALVKMLDNDLSPKSIKAISSLLDTDNGRALTSYVLSQAINKYDHKSAKLIAEELRIESLALPLENLVKSVISSKESKIMKITTDPVKASSKQEPELLESEMNENLQTG